MDRVKIVSFVYHNCDTYTELRIMKPLQFTFWFLAFFGTVAGIVGGGSLLIISFCLDALALAYTAIIIEFEKREEPHPFEVRFFRSGITASFLVVYFLTVAILAAEFKSLGLLYGSIMFLGIAIFLGLYWLYTKSSIKRNIYHKKRNEIICLLFFPVSVQWLVLA